MFIALPPINLVEDRICSPKYLLKNIIGNKNNSHYLLNPHQLSSIYSISFNIHENTMKKNYCYLQLGNRPSQSVLGNVVELRFSSGFSSPKSMPFPCCFTTVMPENYGANRGNRGSSVSS